MRKFVLLILFFMASLSCFAQDRKFSPRKQVISITELFKEIQNQCGYTFVYSDEVVSDTIMVEVPSQRVAVSVLLDNVLSTKGLYHQMLSEQMIIIGSEARLKQERTQSKISFSGKLISNEGSIIPFATILLFVDELHVNGTIANEKGEFQFSHAPKKNEKYMLQVSSLGYETTSLRFNSTEIENSRKVFGEIHMKAQARNLKEVNVVGSQNLIELDGGNIIFNVAKSITAQGSNALELLSRAPGVTVSTNQDISLNGKAGAAILIDGKQTYLSNRDLAELLRSMSSSDIKSIEIISSPSAKYDAAGTAGIINVKTQKSTIKGFNAAINSGLQYGVYVRNNQELSLSYRRNKLNIFANYNHFVGYYSYLYGADRIQEGKFYNSYTDDVDKRWKMGSRIGADYAINKNHTVGILVNGNFIFGGGITDTRTDIGQAQTTTIDQTLSAINDYYYQQTERYNLNLNYKYEDTTGTIINFDADYGDFTKNNGNLQSNTYTTSDNNVISDHLYRSLNGIDISLRAFKLDYTKPLWKGKLETGAKYSLVSADNDARFLEVKSNGEFIDPNRTNRFVYDEEITAAYVNYQKLFGKMQLQGGLRVEHSASRGRLDELSSVAGDVKATNRNYTNWFPFFSATYKATKAHSFSLSYSRRIERPAYQNLNPFIYLLDELSYWQGNPFLEPQLSHRLLLQYAFKSSTILGLSYTHTDKFSVEVTDAVDDTRIVMVPRNLGLQQHLALTATQILKPLRWWDLNFNGTLFGLRNDIDFGRGRALDLQQIAGRISLQQQFKLPYQINAEVMTIYNSKRLAGANKFSNATSQIDLGLQRSFMDNKASLRLVFADIYKGTRAVSVQQVGDLYIRNFGYFEARQVRLNFSYRFSTGNSKGPRNRSSALENENGRIK